jgi:hypothetical protein
MKPAAGRIIDVEESAAEVERLRQELADDRGRLEAFELQVRCLQRIRSENIEWGISARRSLRELVSALESHCFAAPADRRPAPDIVIRMLQSARQVISRGGAPTDGEAKPSPIRIRTDL